MTRAATLPNNRVRAAKGLHKPTFAQRFKAWWEGVELAAPGAVTRSKPDKFLEQPLPGVRLESWETPDLKVKQTVWGEGFHGPGGEPFIADLVKPFALNSTMSVLDFGCGMGGSTRLIAKKFDIWVTGVERDASLVQAAKVLSKRAGLERRAEIVAQDDAEFVSRPGGGRYDCILSIEALCGFTDREIILAKLDNSLKPRGQLLVTDLVLGKNADARDRTLILARGDSAPPLWLPGDYERRFKELDFDLRISEDFTGKYREMVIAALAAVAQSSTAIATARAFPEAFLSEVESWAARVKAIDSGALCVRRFYAIKLGKSKMMSDWS